MVAFSLFGFTSGTGDTILETMGALLGPGPKGETIRIASWNIRDFGRAKATDEERMGIIAQALQGYDIIAVQEVSNLREQGDPGCPRNDDACPGDPSCGLVRKALERHLNGSGLNYSLVFSPQVRDERYLYIYNPERVELEEASLAEDPGDSGPACLSNPMTTGLMARQPFMARFRAGDFDFVLLNVHTSPSMNIRELDGLEYFYGQARKEEPDVIVLGDLNADCDYLGPGDMIGLRGPEYIWPLGDDLDTTVGQSDCAYDRFIFTSPTDEDFTGKLGIVRGIPPDVSDHYLIWAEFYTGRDSD
jgi:deoxyribonuclease-1-like protein